jgi:hypothetical protein
MDSDSARPRPAPVEILPQLLETPQSRSLSMQLGDGKSRGPLCRLRSCVSRLRGFNWRRGGDLEFLKSTTAAALTAFSNLTSYGLVQDAWSSSLAATIFHLTNSFPQLSRRQTGHRNGRSSISTPHQHRKPKEQEQILNGRRHSTEPARRPEQAV